MRKGLENNLARKCLAGMLSTVFKILQTFFLQTSIAISQVLLYGSMMWLSFPHQHEPQHFSARDISGQGFSLDPSPAGQKLMSDYVHVYETKAKPYIQNIE